MRKLGIDFLRAPVGRRVGLALLIVGVAASGGAIGYFSKLERAKGKLESIPHDGAPYGKGARSGGTAENERLRSRMAATASVMSGLNRPWEQLFADLESAGTPDIGLLGLEPDARRAEVRISGEARDGAALSEYITSLERTSSLKRVSLSQHELVPNQNQGALRFVLVGVWTGVRR